MQVKLDRQRALELRNELDLLRSIYEKAREGEELEALDNAREEYSAALTEFHGFIMRITSWASLRPQMANAASV